MDSDPDEEFVAVDVRMPAALFTDLDAYAVTQGYGSVDAAASDAIENHLHGR